MKLNLKNPIIFFDLETTGLDIAKDRIVELCYIRVEPNGNEESKSMRINPEVHIPEEASRVHGIYDIDVKDCPTFKQIAKTLWQTFEGCDLAGYNSNKFDIPLLVEEFMRAGVEIDLSKRKLVDVQNIYHKLERRTLIAAYKYYCGKDLENNNIDFAGRFVYAEDGTELVNFGKYKGKPVKEVLHKDPGYYGWIMQGDFTMNTKQILTKLRFKYAAG